MKTSETPSAFRRILVPIVVTTVAAAFWVEYYETVSWWPVVLFVIWAANYAAYAARRKPTSRTYGSGSPV